MFFTNISSGFESSNLSTERSTILYSEFVPSVVGDGNSLYHSIVSSNVIRTSSANLRYFVDELSYVSLPVGDYVSTQRLDGKWDSTLDMCFVSIVLCVNMVSICNPIGGLKCFSGFKYRYFHTLNNTCKYIVDSVPTIWAYHHLHKQPFVPSAISNHFCSL